MNVCMTFGRFHLLQKLNTFINRKVFVIYFNANFLAMIFKWCTLNFLSNNISKFLNYIDRRHCLR